MKIKSNVKAGQCWDDMKTCEAICGPGKCAFAAGLWCPGPDCQVQTR